MADILLVAVNSSFSHTNIAVRYLKYYSKCDAVDFCEYTINQPLGEILRGISSYNPKIVLFSTYIWNIEAVVRIARNLKALKPELIIGVGGPETGFRGPDFLKETPEFDLIIKGEGESVFSELAQEFLNYKTAWESKDNEENLCSVRKGDLWREAFLKALFGVKGLYLRNSSDKNEILFTGDQELLCNLGEVPFPYPDLEQMDVNHKIFYYESSRGCPFSCAYCMSSLDTKVRFVPLEKVFADLQRFLDAGVSLVKFVDRTYNLKPDRYIAIWKYILEHHNGKTMFHFEIEGEFLSEEAMEFLQTVPEGIMQFEIGVQSSNPVVLKACGRSPEVETLRGNIVRIPKTIHTHLDLIAGLPFEDLESFGHSLDFVMTMEPDALQLGFLKVLYGAPINAYCSATGWKWMKTPPYEVMETPYLSYSDILFLKDLEVTLDAFWNDHHFDTVMKFLAAVAPVHTKGTGIINHGTSGPKHTKVTEQTGEQGELGTDALKVQGHAGNRGSHWWNLFVSLTAWLRNRGAFAAAHQKDYWAEKLFEYLTSGDGFEADFSEIGKVCISTAQELLRFDYISGGKKTNPPAWLLRNYDDQGHYNALQKTTGIKHSRLDFVYSDFDSFRVNPLDPATWFASDGKLTKGTGITEDITETSFQILFLYPRKESDRPSEFQRKPHQILISD